MIKPLCLISTVLLLFSCEKKTEFYVGTWELNAENGLSTLTLAESDLLHWEIGGALVSDSARYEATKSSAAQVEIVSGGGWDCIQLSLQRLTDALCIGCTYKCHLDENQIDEVFLARRNGHRVKGVPRPEKETIVLPFGWKGEFFVVYQEIDDSPSDAVVINENGIGISKRPPDFKQLYNANRDFKFSGMEKPISIANPNGYPKYYDLNPDSLFNEGELYIVQKGFNQSARDTWNTAHGEDQKQHMNIEYFELCEVSFFSDGH